MKVGETFGIVICFGSQPTNKTIKFLDFICTQSEQMENEIEIKILHGFFAAWQLLWFTAPEPG